tara:strand:+ start:5001 stop:5633 length:633 start_codon:yes stop_codon:yes gene_type:complete
MTHLYVRVNKCGSTSLTNLFNKFPHILIPHNDLPKLPDKKNLRLIKKSKQWKQFKKFTVVRHPIFRFISAINHICRDKKLWSNRGFANIITNDSKMLDFFVNITIDPNQKYEFNTDLYQFFKRHTLPLTHPHYCILDENNNLDIDYWIKLKDLKDKQKLNEFFNFINIPVNSKILHSNKGVKVFKHTDLSAIQLKKLENYYKKDYEIFNY